MKKIVVILLFLTAPVWADSQCHDDFVRLRGNDKNAQFKVELADTAQSQAKGLMHRKSLPRYSGMLFVFPKPKPAVFWMRNTLIPLDMLFFDRTGRLEHIHHNAIPLDDTQIKGGDEIQYVLEINAGLAKRFGLETGMTLQHPSIDERYAAWGCDP